MSTIFKFGLDSKSFINCLFSIRLNSFVLHIKRPFVEKVISVT
jgi:hypothetical protein